MLAPGVSKRSLTETHMGFQNRMAPTGGEGGQKTNFKNLMHICAVCVIFATTIAPSLNMQVFLSDPWICDCSVVTCTNSHNQTYFQIERQQCCLFKPLKLDKFLTAVFHAEKK